MNNVFEAAWVIARRDFAATVYSRAFILFMLAPVFILGISIVAGQYVSRADRDATRTTVALVADSQTTEALQRARSELVAGTSENAFPALRNVAPAENLEAQARELISDREGSYSAVLTGTIDQPVLYGPSSVDQRFAPEIKLLVERARTSRMFAQSGAPPPPVTLARVETDQAAGNLRTNRHLMARIAQMIIFSVTLMLATMLVSNFVEEKSNKIIEVLAAAVPLDAIFLGKLVATLFVSLLGIALWGGLLALGYLFIQVLQNWISIPTGPAIGWPAFAVLAFLYYGTNFMLLGTIFLAVGSQASSVKEIQTISMPLVLGQVAMVVLAGITIGGSFDSPLVWFAYAFPLSSPLAMIGHAVQSEEIWPHLVALAWQLLWVFILIRVASAMFRRTVLKSNSTGSIFGRKRRNSAA